MPKFDFKILSTFKNGKRCHIKTYKLGGDVKEIIIFIPNDWEGEIERYEDKSGVLNISVGDRNISFGFEDDSQLERIIKDIS